MDRIGQWDHGLEAEGIVNYEDGCKLEDDGTNTKLIKFMLNWMKINFQHSSQGSTH